MSPTTEPRYTLTELADLAGVTSRTIRYYLSQGLLPSNATGGPGAKYDDAHLARLRLIKRFQRDHQPLAEIRRHLEGLDDDAVLRLAEEAPVPVADSALEYIRRVTAPRPALSEAPARYDAHDPPDLPGPPYRLLATKQMLPAPSAPAAPADDIPPEHRLERSQWERVSLGPDVELHIRRPLPRSVAKRVDRLISIARDLLEEEPS
jgi:DNA-binding transcriptional MerR regulator